MASDGGVFSYGDAVFYGSTGSMHLNQPVVGMAVVPGGGGYWLVAADGGIFSYGDATFYGSTGSMHLNQPVVGMAATPTGHGYWLVAADGGIFSYGDASFHGSTGSLVLNKPIVGMITGPAGAGYFLVASDGGIFSFGTAPFYGSLGGQPLKNPIVAAAVTPTGNGYLVHRRRGTGLEFRLSRLLRVRREPLQTDRRHGGGPRERCLRGGSTYPSGAYGYDISYAQCGKLPDGRPRHIGIVQWVKGESRRPSGHSQPLPGPGSRRAGAPTTRPDHGEPPAQPVVTVTPRATWAIRKGLNVYALALMFGSRFLLSRGGSTSRAKTRTGLPTSPRACSSWRACSTCCMRVRGSPTSVIPTPAPESGTRSSATTSPTCPTGWPTTSLSPSGPGSCADYSNCDERSLASRSQRPPRGRAVQQH